jgi:hypothetical protein
VEAKGNITTVSACFVIFCSVSLYLLWPESDVTYDMFVFDIVNKDGERYRMMISKQAYFDYLAARGAFVLFHVVLLNLTRFKWQMWFFTLAWFGYLIDYVLIYNQPYFYFEFLGKQLPGMYSVIMAIALGLVTITTAVNEWKK